MLVSDRNLKKERESLGKKELVSFDYFPRFTAPPQRQNLYAKFDLLAPFNTRSPCFTFKNQTLSEACTYFMSGLSPPFNLPRYQ